MNHVINCCLEWNLNIRVSTPHSLLYSKRMSTWTDNKVKCPRRQIGHQPNDNSSFVNRKPLAIPHTSSFQRVKCCHRLYLITIFIGIFTWQISNYQGVLTCVSAEHSTYLTAFNSLWSFSPCSRLIGFCLFLASFSSVAASSRKSICVPTNRNGVFWQWCVISGTHCKKIHFICCRLKISFLQNGVPLVT